MRTARRIAFASPLVVVVVGCHRPAPQYPEREEDEGDDDNDEDQGKGGGAPAVVSPPVDAAPDAWRPPKQFVVELKPLTSDRTIEDVCQHARCNPPPPYKPSKPDPAETKTVYVEQMKREGTGSRVRLSRGDIRSGSDWRAVFVNQAGEELPNGDCAIVAWDFHQLECTTALSPEQLTGPWEPLHAKLIPPRAVVERVERERASWPEPISRTSPAKGRVIAVSVTASGTEVMIGSGTDAGIEKSFEIAFVQGDRPIPDGACTIVSVTARTTRCTTKLTPDQVRQSQSVIIQPPK